MVLREAKQRGVVLDPELIKNGQKTLLHHPNLLKDREFENIAWDTLEQFLEYASSSSGQLPFTPKETVKTDVSVPQGQRKQFSDLLFDGVAVRVDGGTSKHNIFHNCVIRYEGRDVDLNGNAFLNCRFEVSRNEQGRHFLQTLIDTSTFY